MSLKERTLLVNYVEETDCLIFLLKNSLVATTRYSNICFSSKAKLVSSIVTKIQIVRVTSKLLHDVKESNNMAEYKANNNHKTYAQQVKLSSSADDTVRNPQVINAPLKHKNQGIDNKIPGICVEDTSQPPHIHPRPSLVHSREF